MISGIIRVSWVVLAACGSELDGAGRHESGDEPVAEEVSALNPSYNSQLYTWIQGTVGPVKMKDTANWFCSLTRVTGAFRGGGEQIRVFANSDGFWYLTGASQQSGVAGDARCWLKSHFLGVSQTGTTQPARWISDEFSVVSSGSGGFPVKFCALTGLASTWWGDAVTSLTGISGNFQGGSEIAQVRQSNDGFTASLLSAATCQNWLASFGYSFFVGNPSTGKAALFQGPNGTGTAAAAGEYATSGALVYMARTDRAMCTFTRIAGNFAGGGEWAQITPVIAPDNSEVWGLVTGSQQSGIFAQAHCYLFDQR